MKQIAVFASGSGSNFQALIDQIKSGKIDAEICGLVASKSNIGAIERAEKNDIPVIIFENEEQLLNQLSVWRTDLIVLAGYLKLIPVSVIRTYENKIINIHPSLLPKYGGKGFYGMKVHEAVIQNGDKESGCTVHYVNEVYDDGPIIAQSTVEVKPDDIPKDLANRVLKEEHILLPKVVATLISE